MKKQCSENWIGSVMTWKDCELNDLYITSHNCFTTAVSTVAMALTLVYVVASALHTCMYTTYT